MVIVALVAMSVFFQTRMHVDVLHGNYYLGALFYGLIMLLVDGFPEVTMTIMRLPVFFKQRDLYLYPVWAYAIPATILKVLSPTSSTFLCALHINIYVPFLGSSVPNDSCFYFGCRFPNTLCFHIQRIHNPSTIYARLVEMGILGCTTYIWRDRALNEFLTSRWKKILSSNTTMGQEVLQSRGLQFDDYFFWVSVGALFGFSLLSNIGYTLALTFLKSPGTSAAIISREKLAQLHCLDGPSQDADKNRISTSFNLTNCVQPDKECALLH